MNEETLPQKAWGQSGTFHFKKPVNNGDYTSGFISVSSYFIRVQNPFASVKGQDLFLEAEYYILWMCSEILNSPVLANILYISFKAVDGLVLPGYQMRRYHEAQLFTEGNFAYVFPG